MPKRNQSELERARATLLPDELADTLTDIVRNVLRRDILALELAPGARLTLRELKSRYGVGATPIREALCSLNGEGLIENEAQSGFRVASATRDRLVGIAGLRQHVEPWILSVSMQQGGPRWLATVQAAYARFAPIDALVGDQRIIDEAWEAAHRHFHIAILGGCNMPALMQDVTRWHAETDRYRRLISPSLGHTVGNKMDHDVLYDAVCRGDTDLAMRTLERHIVDTSARHLTFFDSVDHGVA